MMKRLKFIFFAFFVLFGFVFVGTIVQAAETVEVEITSYFDANNEVKATVVAHYGDQVSFASELPSDAGYDFVFWVQNGKVVFDEDLNSVAVDYSFTVTENTKLKAVFKPTGKYAVVFMDANGDVLKVQYVNKDENASDEDITLPTKPGYVVRTGSGRWDKPLIGINVDTILTLQYEKVKFDTYILTVEGGTGSTTAAFDEVVEVVANNPEDFKYWKVGNKIVSNQPIFKFTMLRDTTITAVYGEEEISDLPLVTISDALSLMDGMNTFVGQYYLPEDYTLIEYGILTSNTQQRLTLNTLGVKKYQGGRINPETNEYVMTLPESTSVCARAYLVYKDSVGNIGTVYNELEQTEYLVTGSISFTDESYEDFIMLIDGEDCTDSVDSEGNFSLWVAEGEHRLYFANKSYEGVQNINVTADIELAPYIASNVIPYAKSRAINDDNMPAGVWELIADGVYGVSDNGGTNTMTYLELGKAANYVLEATIRRSSTDWDTNNQLGFLISDYEGVSTSLILNLRGSANPYMRIQTYGGTAQANKYKESQLLIGTTFPSQAQAIMATKDNFTMKVVKKDAKIYLFLNGIYTCTFNADDGWGDGSNLSGVEGAFGFAVRGKPNNGTTFSNYSYSTDPEDIADVLEEFERTISIDTMSEIDGTVTVTGVENNKAMYGTNITITVNAANEGKAIVVKANGVALTPISGTGLEKTYIYQVEENTEITFEVMTSYLLVIDVQDGITLNSVTIDGVTTSVTNNNVQLWLSVGEKSIYFDCGDYEALESYTVIADNNNRITLSKVANKLSEGLGAGASFTSPSTGVQVFTSNLVTSQQYAAKYFVNSGNPNFVIETKVKLSDTSKMEQPALLLYGTYNGQPGALIGVVLLHQASPNNRMGLCGFTDGVPGGWFNANNDLLPTYSYTASGEYTLKYVMIDGTLFAYVNGNLVRTWSGISANANFDWSKFTIEKVGIGARYQAQTATLTFSDYSYSSDLEDIIAANTMQYQLQKSGLDQTSTWATINEDVITITKSGAGGNFAAIPMTEYVNFQKSFTVSVKVSHNISGGSMIGLGYMTLGGTTWGLTVLERASSLFNEQCFNANANAANPSSTAAATTVLTSSGLQEYTMTLHYNAATMKFSFTISNGTNSATINEMAPTKATFNVNELMQIGIMVRSHDGGTATYTFTDFSFSYDA
jgi:hypothetical protein